MKDDDRYVLNIEFLRESFGKLAIVIGAIVLVVVAFLNMADPDAPLHGLLCALWDWKEQCE